MKSLLIVALSLAFWGFNAQAKTANAKHGAGMTCHKATDLSGHKHGEGCGCTKDTTNGHGHAHWDHKVKDASGMEKTCHHVEHGDHDDICDKPHA